MIRIVEYFDINIEKNLIFNENIKTFSLNDFLIILPELYKYNISANMMQYILNSFLLGIDIFDGSYRFALHEKLSDICIKFPKNSILGVIDTLSAIRLYELISNTSISKYLIPIWRVNFDTKIPIVNSIYLSHIYDDIPDESKYMVEEVNHYLLNNHNIFIDGVLNHPGNLGEFNCSPTIIDYGKIFIGNK